MVRWLRWHCPPDTGFEIRALAVWGRARYLSVTEAPHNTDFHTWMGKKHFCFFQATETGNRTPNSGVKGSGANHYPRAPAPESHISNINVRFWLLNSILALKGLIVSVYLLRLSIEILQMILCWYHHVEHLRKLVNLCSHDRWFDLF